MIFNWFQAVLRRLAHLGSTTFCYPAGCWLLVAGRCLGKPDATKSKISNAPDRRKGRRRPWCLDALTLDACCSMHAWWFRSHGSSRGLEAASHEPSSWHEASSINQPVITNNQTTILIVCWLNCWPWHRDSAGIGYLDRSVCDKRGKLTHKSMTNNQYLEMRFLIFGEVICSANW